ncbi:MAG: hypothetical protein WC804_11565 [Sphingomonas sp.]|jgi:hypothetical protein|uniref:hypothetical protein n=1 Tax=Sphingomonas sp. TaxID=28214 RepID=UPI003565C113
MSTTDLITSDLPSGVSSLSEFGSSYQVNDRHESSRQWTIKGLAPETVEVSRDAAKRSGMKLNAWVSRALERAATNGGVPAEGTQAKQPPSDVETIQHIRNELERLHIQTEDMKNTMQTMTAILLKLCAQKM